MGAMAYGGHRKAAVGWTEGRASAASGLTRARVTVLEGVKATKGTPPTPYASSWARVLS